LRWPCAGRHGYALRQAREARAVTLAKKPANPIFSLVSVPIESVPDDDFGPPAAIDCRASSGLPSPE
jgi:hypothetical protein